MKEYFEGLQKGFTDAYSVAEKARAKNFDPDGKVEILPAEDIAARVEGIVGPPGIAARIREMGMDKKRETLAFDIVKEILERNQGDREKVVEQAVRTGVAILTEGVLVAPTEGISAIKIKKNPDGSDYLAMYFSGPIRSAGGTVAALSVVLADFARKKFNIADYRPTDTEVERYVEEIAVYDVRAARLQYRPTDDEIRIIVKNCPVCIDGEPTEEFEVSVHKDLPRIETNRVRGGMCLVIGEGIAQKASKVMRYTKNIGLNWGWLEACVKVPKKELGGEIKPNSLYLDDIVAGRPIFSYPSEKGGFRLRYGRTRMSGIAAKAIHPATMVLLDGFLTIGTQMKVERPGKGCIVTPCSTIEGPFVKLKDGSVLQLKSVEEVQKVKNDVETILSLGDILISYGDFYKSNHPLIPSGYCEEFWRKELEKAAKEKGADPKTVVPQELSGEDAFKISEKFGVPLHPNYTYLWHDITADELKELVDWLANGRLVYEWFKLKELRVEKGNGKAVLEELCVPHKVEGNEIVLREHAIPLLMSLGILQNRKIGVEKFNSAFSKEKKAIDIVRELAGVKIREKAPVYIGARMGRPEKARERKMKPAPHVLFPIGNWGGSTRDIVKAYRKAKESERYEGRGVIVEVARMTCPSCKRVMTSNKCPLCDVRTVSVKVCMKCGKEVEREFCERCKSRASESDSRGVNLVNLVDDAVKKCGALPEEIKGVKGMTSRSKIPEPLEKGILRAKHGVFVFKDGTARFDSTNVLLTHFRANEVGISMEKVKELGYSKDYEGKELKDGNQLVEMKPQDVIVSDRGAEYFVKVANFIDDSLVYLYGLPPFYNVKGREDLVGKLVVTLSPHTSCGVLGRIIGFTKAHVGYAHPYMISARRRNCFSGDENIPLFDGALWNFFNLGEITEKMIRGGSFEKDAFGNMTVKNSKYSTFAFNLETKRFDIAKVTAFSKHVAPEHLVITKTKSGRSILTTGEHPFLSMNGSEIERSYAFEMKNTLAPSRIDVAARDVKNIDLLESSSEIMVRGIESLGAENLKKLAEKLGVNYKTFMDFVYRKSIPLEILRKMKLRIPRNVRVGAKRDDISLRRFVEVDSDFLFLLGFYIAEGYSRKKDKSHYQVCFTATKPEVKKLICKKIRKVFGYEPIVGKNVITISSRVVYELFNDFLKAGSDAYSKNVPQFVFSLPKKKVAAFLSGCFTGDGSVSLSNSVEVNYTSVNKKLIDEIAFLLLRFGMKHGISKEERVVRSKVMIDFYGHPISSTSYKIRMYGRDAKEFIREIGFALHKQKKAEAILRRWNEKAGNRKVIGDVFIDEVKERKIIRSKRDYVYALTVEPHHSLICSNIVTMQCDGDEDSMMLLLDALINFSKKFLPDSRGGTMDASLVLTTVVDPKEVDDEVHAMEICSEYPLELYESSLKFENAGEVKVEKVSERLGKPEQYYGINFTHETGSLEGVPLMTKYVELKSMKEKIDAQFALCEKIRAVKVKDATERLILSHFLPDLYGNLRSFSRQIFRCVSCNSKYRRVPLSGKCRRCGGKLVLTISKGGIEKYLKISQELVERYQLPNYLKQRLTLLENDISSVFGDEDKKQFSLAEFM